MSMSDQNLQAIAADRIEAMNRSGIYRRWHNTTLLEVQGGSALKGMILDNTIFDRMREGKGLTFYGEPKDHPVFPVFAKGLLLSNKSVRLMSVFELAQAMEDKWFERVQQAESIDALFLDDFVIDGEFPLTPAYRAKIERLIKERWARLLPTFFFVATGCTVKDWWTRFFDSALREMNEDYVIGEGS